MVRELFVMAREHAPSIIFMDEIDSIGSSRLEGGSGGDSEVQRTMLELLNQLDGFEATKNIKVNVQEDPSLRTRLFMKCSAGRLLDLARTSSGAVRCSGDATCQVKNVVNPKNCFMSCRSSWPPTV